MESVFLIFIQMTYNSSSLRLLEGCFIYFFYLKEDKINIKREEKGKRNKKYIKGNKHTPQKTDKRKEQWNKTTNEQENEQTKESKKEFS